MVRGTVVLPHGLGKSKKVAGGRFRRARFAKGVMRARMRSGGDDISCSEEFKAAGRTLTLGGRHPRT